MGPGLGRDRSINLHNYHLKGADNNHSLYLFLDRSKRFRCINAQQPYEVDAIYYGTHFIDVKNRAQRGLLFVQSHTASEW